jgi:hypothetical protein
MAVFVTSSTSLLSFAFSFFVQQQLHRLRYQIADTVSPLRMTFAS